MWNPSDDRVLLKPVAPETETKSGLLVPLEAQKITMWEIVAIGPHVGARVVITGDKIQVVQNPEIKVKVGMLVIIPDSAGIDIEIDGVMHKCIRHTSIELYDERA